MKILYWILAIASIYAESFIIFKLLHYSIDNYGTEWLVIPTVCILLVVSFVITLGLFHLAIKGKL